MGPFAVAATLVSLVPILCGCVTYRIGEEKFHSRAAALERQARIHGEILAQILPTPEAVGGAALILIPSDVEFQRNFLRYGDNASSVNQNQIDFCITAARSAYDFVADAIARYELFDSMTIERHAGNPAQFPLDGEDFVVFADVDGWFVKTSRRPRPLPVPLDMTKPAELTRTLSFLDTLQKRARDLLAR